MQRIRKYICSTLDQGFTSFGAGSLTAVRYRDGCSFLKNLGCRKGWSFWLMIGLKFPFHLRYQNLVSHRLKKSLKEVPISCCNTYTMFFVEFHMF